MIKEEKQQKIDELNRFRIYLYKKIKNEFQLEIKRLNNKLIYYDLNHNLDNIKSEKLNEIADDYSLRDFYQQELDYTRLELSDIEIQIKELTIS